MVSHGLSPDLKWVTCFRKFWNEEFLFIMQTNSGRVGNSLYRSRWQLSDKYPSSVRSLLVRSCCIRRCPARSRTCSIADRQRLTTQHSPASAAAITEQTRSIDRALSHRRTARWTQIYTKWTWTRKHANISVYITVYLCFYRAMLHIARWCHAKSFVRLYFFCNAQVPRSHIA